VTTHPVWINLIGKAPAWLLLAYNFHSSFQFSPVYWWAFHIFSRKWIINENWIFIGICIKNNYFLHQHFCSFCHWEIMETLHTSHYFSEVLDTNTLWLKPSLFQRNVLEMLQQFLLKLVVNIFRHWVIFSVYFYDYNVRCMLNIGLEQLPKVLLQYICSVIHYLCEQLQ